MAAEVTNPTAAVNHSGTAISCKLAFKDVRLKSIFAAVRMKLLPKLIS